ncbi:cyclic nucleotide-binding domain-containing protein 2-like [Tubulanus polymorphus]|uniref:cyclic nucleotide-binding domain-containing protein 2-like n=1 Tax=Tubulanus polymorphus TaxID=672921 RepID=UPI003DA3AECF
MVIYVKRILRSMIGLSADLTTSSATQLQWYALNSPEGDELAFNPLLFNRDKIHTRVPEWTRSILELSADERTERDIHRLHALLRGLKSMSRFTQKVQLAMCRAFSYMSVDAGRVILRENHVGLSFYFIYSGSVFVNVSDVTNSGEHFVTTEKILTQGESFGELALLKDVKRSATVTTRENCELLTIDKYVFSEVCPQIFQQEIHEKFRFMSSLAVFSRSYWPDSRLSALCFETVTLDYKINKVIVRNSQTDDYMYICMQGKCRILKRLATPSPQRSLSRRSNALSAPPQIVLHAAEPCSDQFDKTVRSNSCPDNKRSLLKSMELPYGPYSNQIEPISSENLLNPEGGGDNSFLSGASIYNRSTPRKRSSISLKTFLENDDVTIRAGGRQTIDLEIGTLSPGDVFDLDSLVFPKLQGQVASPGVDNCLYLVSSGARLLRFKKSTFHSLALPEAVEHCKAVAAKMSYPSDDVLLNSYQLKTRWNLFRNALLHQVAPRSTEVATKLPPVDSRQASGVRRDVKMATQAVRAFKFTPAENIAF